MLAISFATSPYNYLFYATLWARVGAGRKVVVNCSYDVIEKISSVNHKSFPLANVFSPYQSSAPRNLHHWPYQL